MNIRLIAGFLIAPIFAPIVFALLTTDWQVFNSWESVYEGIQTVLLFGLLLAYAIALIIGFPVWLLFKYFGMLNFWTLSIGSGLIAILPAFFLICIPEADTFISAVGKCNETSKMMFLCGVSVGTVFWFIAYYRNEN